MAGVAREASGMATENRKKAEPRNLQPVPLFQRVIILKAKKRECFKGFTVVLGDETGNGDQ